MAVCLSTLCGHIVAHRSSSSVLFIYIISIFSLLCLEVSVIVAIFYKMNWEMQLAKFIDKNHIKFKDFLIFHVNMCRLIVILILVPQIKVIVLAAILWVIGAEPRAHCNDSEIPNFRYSFLAAPTQSVLDVSRHGFRNYEASPRESFLSYVNRFFRMQFHRRVSLS
ncbi:hypothetical protein PRUPE_1G451700 [Prunus persica]|nr:hypothetical protein PRUPE_1G451700 [Prunus persica]ONI33892.1 hypothetical protein PRUPE_1G451700 [Prunus persica]ONI33893.1 hypothetical protein PRUPE_1G451700 [Prunus persica]